MPFFLWTLASLIAYGVGLVILIKMTPLLLSHTFDEWSFTVIAAADLLGSILIFAAVAVPMMIFNGAIGARILAFLLLAGMVIVGIRMSYRSFRPRRNVDTFRSSRVLAGVYCLLLCAAALTCIVLLFTLALPSF